MADLFDMAEAQAAKERAIERAAAGAASWMDAAVSRIAELCKLKEGFTSDDLWEVLPEVRERRALGAAMKIAQERGLCYPTSSYVPSKRVACHARPVRVWRSKHGS